jgi:hypothetical protein
MHDMSDEVQGSSSPSSGNQQMFNRQLTNAGHVRRFTIREAQGQGWEVREEEDSRVVRHTHYHDWHRVERAMLAMQRQVSELEARGWRQLASC